jgi:hypothetical protein
MNVLKIKLTNSMSPKNDLNVARSSLKPRF